MASAIYDSYTALIMTTGLNLSSLNLKCLLVDTGTYTYSAAHDFHNDITGIVATSGNLASKTTTGRAFDAADVTFSSVTGASVEAIVIYNDTTVSSTSDLIAYIDGFSAVTPNGGDITITWNASGIITW